MWHCEKGQSADAEGDIPHVHVHSFEQSLSKSFDNALRIFFTDICKQDGKLIAAETGKKIRDANLFLDRIDHGFQNQVTNRVTLLIVDRLEIIQVNINHSIWAFINFGMDHSLFSEFIERTSIQGAGQWIGAG